MKIIINYYPTFWILTLLYLFIVLSTALAVQSLLSQLLNNNLALNVIA